MDKNIKKVKEDFLFWSKRLYKNGMSPATSGNVSVRFGSDFLVSASGVCAYDMNENDIILIDKNAKILDDNQKKPTSEKIMHLEIYKERKDINAIIHCHCPILTAFAVAGIEMEKTILPDFALLFGKVRLVPYYCPSTKELAQAVKKIFKTDDVALLKNHGIILGADNLKNTYYKLESLRAYAQTYLFAQILGGAKSISKKSIEEIKKIYIKK